MLVPSTEEALVRKTWGFPVTKPANRMKQTKINKTATWVEGECWSADTTNLSSRCLPVALQSSDCNTNVSGTHHIGFHWVTLYFLIKFWLHRFCFIFLCFLPSLFHLYSRMSSVFNWCPNTMIRDFIYVLFILLHRLNVFIFIIKRS